MYSNNITISNFKLVAQDPYPVIKIESVDTCMLTNNTIFGNPNYYQGIYAIKSKKFKIERNEFYHLNTGIYIDRGGRFIISNNSFSNCTGWAMNCFSTSFRQISIFTFKDVTAGISNYLIELFS